MDGVDRWEDVHLSPMATVEMVAKAAGEKEAG